MVDQSELVSLEKSSSPTLYPANIVCLGVANTVKVARCFNSLYTNDSQYSLLNRVEPKVQNRPL